MAMQKWAFLTAIQPASRSAAAQKIAETSSAWEGLDRPAQKRGLCHKQKEVEGFAALPVSSTRTPQRASCRLPLRTASTISRIASITSRGLLHLNGVALFVSLTCFALRRVARRS